MTVGIGTKFNSAFADGCPEFTVIQKKGQGIWLCRVEDDPDWTGHEAHFSTAEIKAKHAWANMFEKIANSHEEFYANLEEGKIVHYHNGFGEYSRCTATADHDLLPIALVGEWKTNSLYSRDLDGSVRYRFSVQSILDKKVFKPHYSNLYEAKNSPMKGDPTTMEPIDLTVSELTKEEKVVAGLWAQVFKIRDLSGDRTGDPEILLRKIKEATTTVIYK